MGIPLNAPLPQGYDLGQSYEVVFTAIDATSGAQVDGVVIKGAVIQAALIEGTIAGLATPLWLPLPLDKQ
jgi:hypothetical protein